MTERRFVLVDFRYTNDVVGHIRLYEAGCTYAMRRGLAHAAQSANSLIWRHVAMSDSAALPDRPQLIGGEAIQQAIASGASQIALAATAIGPA